MALLTVSAESAFTEAGISVLKASVFYGLAANFGSCACVLLIIRHSMITKASAEVWRLHVAGNRDRQRRIRR